MEHRRTFRRRGPGPAAMVAALLLPVAGCGGPSGNVAVPPAVEAEEARQALQYAGAQGPVLAVIRGEPLERPGRADEVLRAVDRGVVGSDVAFTTDPALASRPEFKLVLQADPARPDDPAAACAVEPDAAAADQAAPPATAAAAGPDLVGRRPSVLAVFCDGARPIAGALADVEVEGQEAPDYDRLVAQSTSALFPDDYWDRYDRLPFSVGLGVGSRGGTSVGVGVRTGGGVSIGVGL